MLNNSVKIQVQEESQVGEARRTVQQWCSQAGADPTFTGRASILVNELARNLVLHAGGGEILFRALPDRLHAGLELLALDRGPGMRNITECMRDGFSTAGTAGTGLGAVRRMADCFEILSAPGTGTAILARLFPPGSGAEKNIAGKVRFGAVNVALAGEEVSGDAWEILESPDAVRVLVADGLGHGFFAGEAAREAVAAFRAHGQRTPADILLHIHDALRKTRGVAAAVVEIRPAEGTLRMAGAGNITVRIFDGEDGSRQMVSVNGTLGAGILKVHEYTAPWPKRGLLVMHSDGISAQWSPETYPGLLERHPALLAGIIYRDFARSRDDATIAALSFSP